MRDLFGIPVVVSEQMPRDAVLLAPGEIVDSLKISEAADVMARHGIIDNQTALGLRLQVKDALNEALRDKRACMITNLKF